MCKTGKILIPKRRWADYWPKTSTKYPQVPCWQAIGPGGKPLAGTVKDTLCKIQLFNEAMARRQKAFHDNYVNDKGVYENLKSQVESKILFPDAPTPKPEAAVIVPSSGKQKVLREILTSPEPPWWVRMVFDRSGKVVVVLLVSKDEEKGYQEACELVYRKMEKKASQQKKFEKYLALMKGKLKLISYQGTGIGNGRTAGHLISEILSIPCWMVDDRVKRVRYVPKEYPPEVLKSLKKIKTRYEDLEMVSTRTLKSYSDDMKKQYKDRILSANTGLRYNFRVLTVVFPDRTTTKKSSKTLNNLKITFPKYFIASKEDLALSELYTLIDDDYCPNWDLTTASKQETKTYKNIDYTYDGKKGRVLTTVINSDVYGFINTKAIKGGTNWDKFKTLGFLNKWDAVKVQETILYELLLEIVKAVGKAYAVLEKQTDSKDAVAIRKAFEADVLSWFLIPSG